MRQLRLQGFNQRRYDLKQIAHDAIIGDFEDGRFGILVDGDDGLRTLSCRPGAGWRPRCRRRHTSSARPSGRNCPPGVPSEASRYRRWGAKRQVRRPAHRRVSARRGMFSASLMPRPTETMICAAARSTARCDSRKQFERLCADLFRLEVGRDLLDRRRSGLQAIGAECAGLDRSEVRRLAFEAHIGVDLALE